MPRARGNDLCEIFGYAPDDYSPESLRQRASQHCPFLTDTICVKSSRMRREGEPLIVLGSCSVLNATKPTHEEVIICPNRLYADKYRALKACVLDAVGPRTVYTLTEYGEAVREKKLPLSFAILFGQRSGKEISLGKKSTLSLSLDWVLACFDDHKLSSIIPCEVQSIDTTGNYFANWNAYAKAIPDIPNSAHGMNWANVWKRSIPQLILKGTIAKHSKLSKFGTYFVVPDRVYRQFEQIIGSLPSVATPAPGVLNIMTYSLGAPVAQGKIRGLERTRLLRVSMDAFSKAFGSGEQVISLGPSLDAKVLARVSKLQARLKPADG